MRILISRSCGLIGGALASTSLGAGRGVKIPGLGHFIRPDCEHQKTANLTVKGPGKSRRAKPEYPKRQLKFILGRLECFSLPLGPTEGASPRN